jgi:hypothetical protein
MNLAGMSIACVLAIGLAGCGSNATAPQKYTLEGSWIQSGSFADTVNQQTHVHLGSFSLTQTGDAFAGTGEQSGVCNSSQGHYAGPLASGLVFPVTDGHISGQTVTFKTVLCRYTGTFENGNPSRITGTGSCSYALNGVQYSFSGQWQMYR